MNDLEYSFGALALGGIAAIVAFFITLRVANFFIAPREHWRQSGFAIVVLKLGMAAGAAFWVFMLIISLFAAQR
jgi:hypothetical protein